MSGLTALLRDLAVDERRVDDDAPLAQARPEPLPEILCADQVAAFLGVNRKTVYEGAARGEIPHRRLGRRLLFARSHLVRWLGAWRDPQARKGF